MQTAPDRSRTLIAILASAAVAAGCAIDPIPTAPLALSEAAISRAMLAGAAQYASNELQLAQDKAVLGRRLIDARDARPALWLVEQAHVDAELAELKAMAARARHAAARAREELRTVGAMVQAAR